MIKFRRGSTKSWLSTNVKLEPGQPGYDKNKHKIKIGDGEKLWSDLPYVSGLFTEEILDSETNAKAKKAKDAEDITLITYGTEEPNKNTVGQIYLQQTDEPEVDYIVESGVNGIWTYQKWKSGIAKCWGTRSVSTRLQRASEESTFAYAGTSSVSYPFTFKNTPTETATIQSYGVVAWLASSYVNTKSASGSYTIISPNEQLTQSSYNISIQVEGFWK